MWPPNEANTRIPPRRSIIRALSSSNVGLCKPCVFANVTSVFNLTDEFLAGFTLRVSLFDRLFMYIPILQRHYDTRSPVVT